MVTDTAKSLELDSIVNLLPTFLKFKKVFVFRTKYKEYFYGKEKLFTSDFSVSYRLDLYFKHLFQVRKSNMQISNENS